jgi:hypothetical protein
MAISEERAEAAVEFLRDTSERYGKARGYSAFCESNLRRVKALEMASKAGGVGEREAAAYASVAYGAALEALQNSVADYETLRALRDAAIFTIEVWRSQNSARKAGI